ncbi:MAG: nucleotide exchange factor GrpE [Candidatus Magasanikbacteria bacterium]|nr:nucleotide exchange factor GrpE [Candidatus Magasanikbacteria bacterium]
MTDENIQPEESLDDIKNENIEVVEKKSARGGTVTGGKKGFFGKACKDCEEYKNGWQRALADYKNLQNEINNRRGEWAQMSETQILEEFIPVYENFKKAFNHHPEVNPDNKEQKTFKNWIEGIGFIMKQFGDILKAHGVEEIKTVGEKFDPKFHEAVSALVPDSDDSVQGKNQESGMIVKELEGGYKVGDKVIKAAKVIVNK